jgi:phosphoribosylglycinamide formyltransferase-1
MLKLVVLVSGGGTNLQHILDRIADGTVKDAKVALVISNNPGAYALERAKQAGAAAVCVSPKDYPTREDFNAALLKTVQEAAPDLIVLAGFLVAIPKAMVEAYPNRIINIHPALIPSFCGKGFYGLHVHEKVLERGVKVTGATVHYVNEGMDSGPIILQKAVEVKDGDTPETLQRRVMEQAEWIILPEAIELIAQGRVEVTGNTTRIREA